MKKVGQNNVFLFQSFNPLNDTFLPTQYGITPRTRPKLINVSSRSELRVNVANGSRRVTSSSGRVKREVVPNTTQQIGLLSLHSASFAYPSLPMCETSSAKGKLFTPLKTPLIVVVGNKEDLCGHSFYPHSSQAFGSTDSDCYVENSRQFHCQRQVEVTNANQLAKKYWKCLHYSCSVKLDWNVTTIVAEILRFLFSPETQKTGRFKKSAMGLKSFPLCK